MVQEALTDGEVLKQNRDLVGKGKVKWRGHAELRLAKYGLARDQVTECLLKGNYEERPTVPIRAGPIEYVFRMRCRIEGVLIRVPASLFPESHIEVITVIDPRER